MSGANSRAATAPRPFGEQCFSELVRLMILPHWSDDMLSWFAIPLYAARLGMEAQNAAALGFFRLIASVPYSHTSESGIDKAEGRDPFPALATKVVASSAKRPDVLVVKASKKRKRSPKKGRRK
jgi:hypothetical protein